MRLFSALAHRPFALLWAARLISSLGDGLYLVALAWWVLETTGSAAANGLILVCTTVPLLLLLLVGGVASDRVSRRGLLVASDAVRGVVVCLIAVLAWQHLLAFWELVALSVIFGAVRAFFHPAYRSILPQITPRELLPSANALASLSVEATGILGPALGGVLVAAGNTPLAFALDGVSFFVSAGCILAISAAAVAVAGAPEGVASGAAALPASIEVPMGAPAGRPSALHELRKGLSTVLRSPWLWISIAVAGVSNVTLTGPLEAALPLLVREGLGAGVGIYALLNALLAIGSAAAAIGLGQAVKIRRRGVLLFGSWMVAAAALAAMGLPVTIVGVGLAIFVCGAGIAVVNLVWANTLQEMVPPGLLGRVASVDALGSYALLPVGYGLAGLAADRLGASAVFVVGGAASVLLIGLGLLHPSVRGLD